MIGLIIGLGLGIFVVRYFDHPIRNFIAKLTPPKIRFSEDSFNVQTKRRYYLVLVLVIIISTSVALFLVQQQPVIWYKVARDGMTFLH